MAKATTIKEALKAWEEKSGEKASEATVVKLMCLMPPIEKMDSALNTLAKCEHLSLSTNAIEKLGNMHGLHNLKILSLGRNQIKKLENLETVSGSLEQLWISYNNLEKLTGIGVLKKLKILYISNNKVEKWTEFEKLSDLPELEELLFSGNPLEEFHTKQGNWRYEVSKRLQNLKKLDGYPVTTEDREPPAKA